MSFEISANELKTRGIKAIDEATINNSEAIITVRGKRKYVIMPIAKYSELRENELESAINESLNDLKEGKFFKESVEEHIKRITDG